MDEKVLVDDNLEYVLKQEPAKEQKKCLTPEACLCKMSLNMNFTRKNTEKRKVWTAQNQSKQKNPLKIALLTKNITLQEVHLTKKKKEEKTGRKP